VDHSTDIPIEKLGGLLLRCTVNLFPDWFAKFSSAWENWVRQPSFEEEAKMEEEEEEEKEEDVAEELIEGFKQLGVAVTASDLRQVALSLMADVIKRKNYPIVEQPINYLLKAKGYDGVLNFLNNNVGSGSVIYNFQKFVDFLT
jgi:hypothetical protein